MRQGQQQTCQDEQQVIAADAWHTTSTHITQCIFELSTGYLVQSLLVQLLSSRYQIIVGLLNVFVLVAAVSCKLMALCIAQPDGLTHHLMLRPLDAYSPVVLSLQHLHAAQSVMHD